MADSRRSNCKKLKAVGVIVVVVMIISFLLYFLLPAKVEKQEVKEENNQNGDNNQVTTIEKKELSLVHMEGLTTQTTGNLLTIMGFLLVLLTLEGMAFHYKIMGAPRRLKKDIEREQILDRIHDVEQVLVDLGHMRKKRVIKKKKKFIGKKKKGMKMQKKVHDIEEAIEEEEEEDE